MRGPAAAPYALSWSKDVDVSTSALVVVGNLFITAGQGTPLQARARTLGDVAWTSTITDTALLTVGDDLVFAAGGGHLRALDPASGMTRWTTTIAEETQWVTPAGAIVLTSGGSEIRALRTSDGSEVWRVAPGAAASTRVALDGTVAVVGLADRGLVALDASTGTERWRFVLDEVPIAVGASQGVAYVGLTSVTTCAFTEAAGAKIWCSHPRVPITGDPIIDERNINVALFDGTFRAFDRRGGTQKAMEPLGGRPVAGPQRAGTTLAVPLSNASIMFVGRKAGQITRLAPPGTQLLLQAVITPDGKTVVTLIASPDGGRALSVYELKPPAAK
ncbi:MAG: PQQ-binding-like beta-propeller repeat protein [Vicinamibacterales bacterium]